MSWFLFRFNDHFFHLFYHIKEKLVRPGLTGLSDLHMIFLVLISHVEFARAQASLVWKPPNRMSLLHVRYQMGWVISCWMGIKTKGLPPSAQRYQRSDPCLKKIQEKTAY